MRVSSLVVLTAALAAFASVAGGQTIVAPKTTVLSIQPLSAIFSVYSLELEHAVAPTVTLGVGGSYWNFDDSGFRTKYSSADFKVRYYPEARPFQGFSFGGQVGYTSITDTEDASVFGGGATSTTNKANGPTIGLALDYNWLLGASRAFYVGLGLGAKKIFANVDSLGSANLTYPTARISIGYAF